MDKDSGNESTRALESATVFSKGDDGVQSEDDGSGSHYRPIMMNSKGQTSLSPKKKQGKGKGKSPRKKRKIAEVLGDETEDDDENWGFEGNESPGDMLIAGVADAMAAKIDENAKKANLTSKNVKSILHHLLTDKLLFEFAQRVALDATENDIEESNDLGVETRLTRSKWKRNKKSEEKQPKFFETDLEDDSDEDEEYDPNKETLVLPSDDDSIPTPCSAVRSPSLPRTPDSFTSQLKNLYEDSEHDIKNDGDGIFKIPGEPLSGGKWKGPSGSNDELIAYRTRSKISMKDLSLESLTATLDPPDYDPALYDYNQLDESDPDDVEWKNWLNGLFKQDDLDESVEENDEDFNFMAVEEEVDQEEFRTDKGVKVTQKELQDMLDGILDDFAVNFKDQSTILKYVIPKFSVADSQRLQISAQLQQHTQLLTQMYMLSYDEPLLERESSNTKMLLKELASFRKAVDNDGQLKDRSIYCFSGLDDATRIIETLYITSELEQKLLERNAMPVCRELPLEKRMNRDVLVVNIPPRTALRIISEPLFATYPELLPGQGCIFSRKLQELTVDRKRVKFFRSEDNLLALGIEQFGKNFDLISKHLLPIATPLQLKTRAKNLRSKREYAENPVRALKNSNSLPTLISSLCINHPREKSPKNVIQRYHEFSSQLRMPLWIDKFQDLLKRLGWSEASQDQAYVSSQVHHGKVFRPICPNGPLPAVAPKEQQPPKKVKPAKPVKADQPIDPVTPVDPIKPADPVKPVKPVKRVKLTKPAKAVKAAKPAKPVKSSTPAKIIVSAQGPCVVELTIPDSNSFYNKRKSKPRKVCKVAKSVQTDVDEISQTSPSPCPTGESPSLQVSTISADSESLEQGCFFLSSCTSPQEGNSPTYPPMISYRIKSIAAETSSLSPKLKDSLVSVRCTMPQANEVLSDEKPLIPPSSSTSVKNASEGQPMQPPRVTDNVQIAHYPASMSYSGILTKDAPTFTASQPMLSNATKSKAADTRQQTHNQSVCNLDVQATSNVLSSSLDASHEGEMTGSGGEQGRESSTIGETLRGSCVPPNATPFSEEDATERSTGSIEESKESFGSEERKNELKMAEGFETIDGTKNPDELIAAAGRVNEVPNTVHLIPDKSKETVEKSHDVLDETIGGEGRLDVFPENDNDGLDAGKGLWSKINDQPDRLNEVDGNSLEENTESGNCSYDDEIEDQPGERFVEENCNDQLDQMTVGRMLQSEVQMEGNIGDGSSSNERLPENDPDAESREREAKRADNREVIKEKGGLRTPVSKRRKKSKNSKFNWHEKLQKKASKFADLYFEKVKEKLMDKPELYCDFLRLIDEAGRTEISRVEVYLKLTDVLVDYPELVDMFVGFLEPSHAKEVGQFNNWLEFAKARSFLLNCESFFLTTKCYHELLKKKINLHETEKDSRKLVESVQSLFRGNHELVAEMRSLLPNLSPPQSHNDDFDVIRYIPESDGFDHVDEFEEVQLKPCDYVDSIEPQQKRKTILDDFAAWLQKPALSATDSRQESRKNEAVAKFDVVLSSDSLTERKNLIDLRSQSEATIVSSCAAKTLFKMPEHSLQNDINNCHQHGDATAQFSRELSTGLTSNGEYCPIGIRSKVTGTKESISHMTEAVSDDRVKADSDQLVQDIVDNLAFGSPSPVFNPPVGRRRSGKKVSGALPFGDQLSKVNDMVINDSQNDLLDLNFTSPVRMQDVLSKPKCGPETPVSGKTDAQNESPVGTKLTTFRINSQSSAMASGFQRIELTNSDCSKELPDVSCPDGEQDRSTIADTGSDESNSSQVNDDSDETVKNDRVCDEGDVPARDAIYDKRGRIIYKWNRNDDRLILMTCQKEGASATTFEKIAQQLKSRTKSEVQERFMKLMELLTIAESC